MVRERVEEYLGAVYRLREGPKSPVPLSQMVSYFHLTPVSVHEMVQKLVRRGLLIYHPYQGVTLTASGEQIAQALLRRHRLWERFLSDVLGVPSEAVHTVAERLEHAAPTSVTERLAALLGEPDHCPHGSPIPPPVEREMLWLLAEMDVGDGGEVVRLAEETSQVKQQLKALGIEVGNRLRVRGRGGTTLWIEVAGQEVRLPLKLAQSVWVALE